MNVRSITENEIDLFTGIAGRSDELKETLTTFWQNKQSFPRWCFVGEENGRCIARVAYWAFQSVSADVNMLSFDVPWSEDYRAVGSRLLRESLGSMYQHGARNLECRLYSDSTTFLDERKKLFEYAGLPLVQEKESFIREEAGKPIAATERLAFRTLDEVGEEMFVRVIQLVTESTLDRDDQLSVKTIGAEKAARNYFNTLKDIDYRPAWWQLAYKTDGTLVGLVVPQKFSSEEGAINYIGVVPEQRGNDYGNDLLIKGTRILQADGVKRIIADIDSHNTPMARALDRAGYKKVSTIWIYKTELHTLFNLQ